MKAAIADEPAQKSDTRKFLVPLLGSIGVLLHNIKHNLVLHEKNLILTVRTSEKPYVSDDDRSTITFISRWRDWESICPTTLNFQPTAWWKSENRFLSENGSGAPQGREPINISVLRTNRKDTWPLD